MRYRDRYLFDLQGYLTIPDALSAETVDQLNEVIDGMARRKSAPRRRPIGGSTCWRGAAPFAT